jgi:large subunit ribosomal protein L30
MNNQEKPKTAKVETPKRIVKNPSAETVTKKKIVLKEGKSNALNMLNAPNASHSSTGKLALVRIRGMIHVKKDIVATIFNLRLRKNNACSVVPDTPANRAAAAKCKDYIAFGEISEDTYNELVDKRGKKDETGALKKFFLLHPPRGGFEKRGIKVSFNRGGALGYRGDKMNELIRKML